MNKIKEPTFQSLLELAIRKAKAAGESREAVEQQLKEARDWEAETRRGVTRLNIIAQYAEWSTKQIEWKDDEIGSGYLKLTRLDTPEYYFTVAVRELSLKRTPYEVSVGGWRTDLSTNPMNAGYRDTSYLADKYGEDELVLRFATARQATDAYKKWVARLTEDHKDYLERMRSLLKMAKESGAKSAKGNILPYIR